jgi:hypothetical protein
MSYLYLASPYTHNSRFVRMWRYEAVRDFGAFLASNRFWFFGPIMHSYDMSQNHQLPHNFEFWRDWNHAMIDASQGVIVFQIDGWDTSRGVTDEVEYAKKIGKPVIYSRETWTNYVHPEYPVL